MVRNHSGDFNPRHNVGFGNFKNAQTDITVVDQKTITGTAVTWQLLESGPYQLFIAGNIPGRDRESIAFAEHLRPFSKGL